MWLNSMITMPFLYLQASFLSLDLHALSEQLERASLSERLFIEPDLLPLEPVCTFIYDFLLCYISQNLMLVNGYICWKHGASHLIEMRQCLFIEKSCISIYDADESSKDIWFPLQLLQKIYYVTASVC